MQKRASQEVATMVTSPAPMEIQIWPVNRLVFYARNPRKNDAAVDRMCSSIREFGFKIPVLARSDGEVVDGHLRLKAAKKLRITEVPVILCDEWSKAQVKAFRLMVNRSVTWAAWDEELLALELQELSEAEERLPGSCPEAAQASRRAGKQICKGRKPCSESSAQREPF
jgi:hypothetical protein